MRITLAGPASLSILEQFAGTHLETHGYPFPYTAELAVEYARKGHQVTVVTTGTDIRQTLRSSGNGMEVIVVPARPSPMPKGLDSFRQEVGMLEEEILNADPQVVHAHWTYEFAIAAQRSNVPTLVTVHDWAPAVFRRSLHPYRLLRWRMQHEVLRRATALNAPSKYIARSVEGRYKKNCEVVPNGVDLSKFGPAGIAPSVRVGMLNAGFARLKNVQTALRAWPTVLARHPDATLVLAGPDYELGGTADKWARQAGLARGVEFVGRLSPEVVPTWFQSLTMFLHTSREESFGLALVEALASGLHVVAGAKSGAVPEVVGLCGELVDVTSPDAVAQAISSVLERTRTAGISEESIRRAKQFDLGRTANMQLAALVRLNAIASS